jgi:prepilin-type N-terminal cleavage/methylation domain-containing protein
MKNNIANSEQQAGFSLIEVIISIGIIGTVVLGLGLILGISVVRSDRSREITLAKLIAVTTLESITTARESEVISFMELSTTKFPSDIVPVKNAGPDNIFGSGDDTGDLIYTAGPSTAGGGAKSTAKFNGTDDLKVNLTQLGYRRRVLIEDMGSNGSSGGLKKITVEVFYPQSKVENASGQDSFKIVTVIGSYRNSLQ